MTHRRAVVQGLQLSNIRNVELASFWIPCMESVKRWAERNDWSYHFFDSAIDNFDTEDLLNIKHSSDKTLRNGQYYKWQWVNSVCDQYDEVLWLDSDIYVWGNPTLPKTVNLDKFKCMCNKKTLAWDRPNLSIFWSSSKTIRELYNWNERMLHNPSERGDIYSCLLTLSRCGHIGDFTEELALIDWSENNSGRAKLFQYERENDLTHKCDWAYDDKYLLEVCTPDSFLHISGHPKQNLLQRFLAYKAYLSYLGTNT